MRNGEAKELICMTHGHEPRWGNNGGKGGTVWRGIKGRKKMDKCNSIIKKYIKKRKKAGLNGLPGVIQMVL